MVKTLRIGIFLSILFMTFLTWNPSSAQACSCAVPQSAEKEMERSDAVFTGTVTKIKKVGMGLYSPKKVYFDVEKTWKGQNKSKMFVVTGIGSGDCGFNFEVGQDYIVYATESNAYTNTAVLTTTLCDLTSNLYEKDANPLHPKKVIFPPSEGKVPPKSPPLEEMVMYAGVWAIFTLFTGLVLWKFIK
ncbi:hypothetical protein ACSVDE_01720 [Pseudalkalibacillus sp. Hm43]|uniref:hypothetical protein n=1 Tax=Pseudalkalibacillus sp. Hm43 TaxID=3450742 RepID=UPI003F41E15F